MAKKDKKEKENKKKKVNGGLTSELKKVIWPTPKQLVTNTAAVIFIVVTVVIIVFVLDFIFEKVNTYGINQIKAGIETNVVDNLETNTATVNNAIAVNSDQVLELGD